MISRYSKKDIVECQQPSPTYVISNAARNLVPQHPGITFLTERSLTRKSYIPVKDEISHCVRNDKGHSWVPLFAGLVCSKVSAIMSIWA
jgi:hypothetical protein